MNLIEVQESDTHIIEIFEDIDMKNLRNFISGKNELAEIMIGDILYDKNRLIFN